MKELVKDIIIALIITVIISQFIKPTIVRERSMEPNFHDGDYLFINKQSYRTGEPARGDVVVFKSELTDEKGKKKLLIKRVIGLPGETIDIHDEQVYIDGQLFEEDYTNDGITDGEIDGLVVPEDSYFCMGDNRLVSRDSREDAVGCVSRDAMVGKVFVRLFPFNKIGTVHNPYDNQGE